MKYTFKLLYRNFRKNLSVSLINVGGLTLSMTVVLMLSAYCYSELTMDLHHDKVDQTYLISSNSNFVDIAIVTPGVLADHLQSTPEVQKVVRLAGAWSPPVVRHDEGESFQTNLMFADDGFFDVFKYHPVVGNLSNALSEPMSAVLAVSEAIRLFGSTDVIGQSLIVNNEYEVQVTAIVDESPSNSFLTFDIIIPVSSIPQMPITDDDFTNWENWFFMTFVQLEHGADIIKTETKVENIFYNNSDKEKMPEAPIISLLPVTDIYFANIDGAWLDFLTLGNKTKVIVLAMIAVLIFIMAIINYLNISAYGISDKMHLSGLFKIIGASRRQLFWNSILESAISFLLVAWMALLFAEVFKPTIQQFTGLAYPDQLLLSSKFIFASMFLAVFISVVSNLINSIRISASPPINSVRKNLLKSKKANVFQGSLVVIQFCATISLISFTILVNKQVKFGSDNMAFAKENLIDIKLTEQLKKEILIEKLEQQSYVKGTSLSAFYPGKPVSSWGSNLREYGEDNYVQFNVMDADHNFVELMNLEIVAGRNFIDTLNSGLKKVIVNESFVNKHVDGSPLGLTINNRFEIVGVVEDFHFRSKNYEIGPLAIINRGYGSHCMVEIHTSSFTDLRHAYESIQNICTDLSPDFPVEISFMDIAVEKMYHSEMLFMRIFTFFSGCAIFISCLGILALSLFASQQRTKEIGIRKVNGAHVEDILMLLNKDFVKWVGIAFFIAIPISWFSMNKWLENFAYKTQTSWWIFLVGGGAALTIALLTVSWQSWIASRRNPIDALRYE